MNYVTLNDGTQVPSLGMGTWYLGEGRRSAAEEERALRAGIEAGITLIDTAEMYGDGAAEELVGRAIRGYDRDELFLVSKVYPHNAGRRNIFRACEDSLRRMGVDCLDLYLLHWRGSVPLQETVDCMEELIRQGRILRWGVSNLDLEDMEELFQCDGGDGCAVNQVLYHLGSRGTEYCLRPWMEKNQVAMMAYCPLAQAGRLRRGLVNSPQVRQVAQESGLTPMQVLLAFVLAQKNTIAIPRTGSAEHAQLNAETADHPLTPEQLERLNAAFPAPSRRVALDIQ